MNANILMDDIIEQLQIEAGDIVMVASDIVRLWAEYRRAHGSFSPEDLIRSILNKVTQEGTVLFPTYSWDFCHGKGFNYYKTAPMTGGLGKIALGMEGFIRTRHPIYSFAAWGKDKDLLYSMDNISSFGEDSPFGYMHKKNGKNLFIGVPFIKSLSFVHYVEEQINVPYRYHKNFTGEYVDRFGSCMEKTYSMYVRNLDMNMLQLDAVESFMENIVRQKLYFYKTEFKILNFFEIYKIVSADIRENRSRNLVSYIGQEE